MRYSRASIRGVRIDWQVAEGAAVAAGPDLVQDRRARLARS